MHFAEKDGVVVFERSQRPTAVSLTNVPGAAGGAAVSGGEETETETEREGGMMFGNVGVGGGSGSGRERETSSYPFPRVPSTKGSSGGLGLSGLGGSGASGGPQVITIDKEHSSAVPSFPGALSPTLLTQESRVHLESIVLSTTPSSLTLPASPGTPTLERTDEDVLKGTILVENVSFSKSVYVRFTLDEWQTTSEVAATWVASLPAMSPSAAHIRSRSEPALSSRSRSPSPGPPSGSSGGAAANGGQARQWDRFAFTLNLSSVRHLHTRRLFLVVRYTPHEWVGSEFWDNNSGSNYSFSFARRRGRAAVESVLSGVNGESEDEEKALEKERGLSVGPMRRSAKPVGPTAATAANVANQRRDESGCAELAS